ncbi:hypothetical protein [Novosphingobium guangzhouense]|uniref:hypothetical protein n=1 Tax=Novosphingobium guangzhouense TaxID=1850347 RepID=UPI0011AF7352|nr:hypothetical protein [Novosphingobium guangzhouense]
MTDDGENPARAIDWRSLLFVRDIAPLPLITAREAEHRLGVRLRRPRQECGRRVKIPYFKMGGAIRYAESDIELYYNSSVLGHRMPRFSNYPFSDISTKIIVLDHHGVATFLTLDIRTIWKFRQFGYGPQYQTYGRHVRYFLGDVISWLKKSRRMDPGHSDRQLDPHEAEQSHT